MRTSMSRKGECWDNAVAESFWNTVKREVLGARKRFLSISEAIEQTESWISYYNAQRPHSAIRMMAPLAYEPHSAIRMMAPLAYELYELCSTNPRGPFFAPHITVLNKEN